MRRDLVNGVDTPSFKFLAILETCVLSGVTKYSAMSHYQNGETKIIFRRRVGIKSIDIVDLQSYALVLGHDFFCKS